MNRTITTYRSLFTRIAESLAGSFGAAFLALTVSMVLNLLSVETADAQIRIVSPKDGDVSELHSQAVIVRTAPGARVELYANGIMVKADTARIDSVTDLLNIQVPSGDVAFEVRQVNSDGSTQASATVKIHILGVPAKVTLAMQDSILQADGSSATNGVVKVYDEWGYPLQSGVVVTLMADSGKIVSEDVDALQRGVQIAVVNGSAPFSYVAGRGSGITGITAAIGQIKAENKIMLNTPTESFTMVGLASGTGMSNKAQGADALGISNSKAYQDGIGTDGRIAVYGRGTVFGKYLFTGSYDSERKNSARLFRDLDPDFLYSIYGDNSMLSYDVQTNRQLFLKLERNQSYLYYGDYTTDMLGQQEFTLYNRTLNGGKFNLQNATTRVAGFASLTDRKVVQMEIRGTGLSGYYDLQHTHITPGSEQIRLETRDRFHSETVLKRQDMYRFTDYEVDNDQGTVYFKQPVSAIDPEGNPVYIVVSFEANSAADRSWVAGGRAEQILTTGLTLGVNGAVEQQEPTYYTLLGSDLKYTMGSLLTIGTEVARSNNVLGSGVAYKIETNVSPIAPLNFKAYYRNVDAGFYNITQAGSGRETGSEKYGVSGTYQLSMGTKLFADYYKAKQTSNVSDANVRSVSGGFEQKLADKFTASARIEDVIYSGLTPDTGAAAVSSRSTLGLGRVSYMPITPLSIFVEREQNFASSTDQTKPDATSLGADYKLSAAVVITGRERVYDGGGALSSIGLTTQPLDNTTLYGKYEVGNAIGQSRNSASIGLKNRMKLPYDLTANFGYERTKSMRMLQVETPVDDHTAYSAGLEYLPQQLPLRLTGKGEYGDDRLSRKNNYNFGGDYRFMTDLSLLAKYRRNYEETRDGARYQLRHYLITGLAFRPVKYDWLNLLAKYELKDERNHYLNPYDDYAASIISAHAYVEPIHRVELGFKYAFRVATETAPQFTASSHTSFYLVSTRVDLTDRLDIGGEYRVLLTREAHDLLAGYSAEAGYVIVNNLRFAAGYNFKGYKDRDLVDYSNWTKGPFVRINFKFSEEIFNMFGSNPTDTTPDTTPQQ